MCDLTPGSSWTVTYVNRKKGEKTRCTSGFLNLRKSRFISGYVDTMCIDHMWTVICISMQIIGSKQCIATRIDDTRRMTFMTLYCVWMHGWMAGSWDNTSVSNSGINADGHFTNVNAKQCVSIYMWIENKLNTMQNKCRWIADWKIYIYINLYVNMPRDWPT